MVSRSAFYQLTELVVNRADTAFDGADEKAEGKTDEDLASNFGIWSGGVFFALA